MLLHVSLEHEGVIIDPSVIENLSATLVSGLGKQTALEASVEADYIVVSIPWVDGRVPGCYSLKLSGSINSLAWACVGKSLIKYTSGTEPGASEVTVEGDTYDVTMEVGYHYTDSPINEVTVNVDGGVGTPSADVDYHDKELDFVFHDIKGETGDRGNGIASIETTESTEPGGINTVTFITDDDPEGTSFHVQNGIVGPQGDCAVYNPEAPDAPDFVMATSPGQSTTKAMTQKAVTDAIGAAAYDGYQVILSEDLEKYDGFLDSYGKWALNGGQGLHSTIPVDKGNIIRIKPICETTTSVYVGLLGDSYSEPVTIGGNVPYALGESRRRLTVGNTTEIVVPPYAKYLTMVILDFYSNEFSYEIEVIENTALDSIGETDDRVSQNSRNIGLKTGAKQILDTDIDSVDFYINASNRWDTGKSCKVIDITNYRGRMARIVKNAGTCQFAFLMSDLIIKNTDAVYAWDDKVVSLSDVSEKTVLIPYDANFIYILSSEGGIDVTPSVYIDFDVASVISTSSFLPVETIDYSGIEKSTYAISNYAWDSNAQTKHFVLPVKPYEIYRLTNTVRGFFAFFTDDYLVPLTSNYPMPFVDGTSRQYVEANTPQVIVIPEGCAYLGFTYIGAGLVQSDWTIEKGEFLREVSGGGGGSSSVEGPVKFRVAHWNIGHYNYGDYIDISYDRYEEKRHAWATRLNDINADILGFCEYTHQFVKASGGHAAISTGEAILAPWKYQYEGIEASGNWQMLSANIPLLNVHQVYYDDVERARYYLVGTMKLGDMSIKIVETHLQFGTLPSSADARAAQIQKLITDFAEDDYVIIAGDFNISDSSEYDVFASAGYQMANHGQMGDIATHPAGAPTDSIDNIVCKGFTVNGIYIVDDDTLTDHCCIYADLTLIK